VYGPIAAAMVDSLRNETVVHNGAAREAFAIQPRGLAAAIERALVNEDHEFAETRWCDALPPAPATSRWGGLAVGRRMVATRAVRVVILSAGLVFAKGASLGDFELLAPAVYVLAALTLFTTFQRIFHVRSQLREPATRQA